MKKALVILGLTLGASGAGQAIAQTAGVVQFAAGEVKILAASGGERVARKGVPVSVGDTLMTPEGGLAQVKMGDGAIVVVQPGSRLTVAEFHYAGVEDGNEKVRYRLDHGGFRAVTGAIGRTHKKNDLIETPLAHMGVRGTDHESYYFPATGPVAPDGAKPGAYNKVNTGRTFIRTDAGEVEVQPNQVGFVASAGQVPEILVSVPGFFNHSIAPRNARRPADSTPEEPATAGTGGVQQAVRSENGVRLTGTRGPKVTPGTGMGPLASYTVAKSGGTAFGSSGNGVALDTSMATMTGTGNDAFGVKWETWDGVVVDGLMAKGTTYVFDAGVNKTNAAQLDTLIAGNVMASYSTLGASFVSNYQGTPGTINSLQVDVNFGSQMITNYSLNATVIGTWDANGSGSISQFTGPTGILLSGTCTGCSGGASTPTASGTAHGTFVGPNAEGLITTFGMNSVNKSISGGAYVER
jgi:hypothetical protein